MNTESNFEKEPDESPPFGGWKRVYWFVAVFFVIEVGLFYVFTKAFS